MDEITGSVIVYSRANCTQSLKAKLLLNDLGIPHLDICLDAFPQVTEQLSDLAGNQFITPQIFFNHIRVPGYESLRRLVATPELWQEVLEMLTSVAEEQHDKYENEKVNNSTKDAEESDIIPVEFDKMIHHFRKANLIREKPGHRNSIKGEDFVNYVMRERKCRRSEALIWGQKLIDRHFGQQSDTSAFNPDNFYQVPDDDPNMPLNLADHQELRSELYDVNDFNERLCNVCDRIYNCILSDNREYVFYERLEDSAAFVDYKELIPQLAGLDLSQSSNQERVALFLNVYNMMLVHIVYKYGPHTNIWQKRKYFNSTYYLIDHQRYSLQSIYNGVLRGNRKGQGMLWKPFGKMDPRRRIVIHGGEPLVHFGINHYVVHGMPIQTYHASTVNAQLLNNARIFLSHSDNFKIDPKKQTVSLNYIFKTFSSDFGNLPEHTVEYLVETVLRDGPDKDHLARLIETGQLNVSYMDSCFESNFIKEKIIN